MKKHTKTMPFLLILSLFISPLGLIQAEEDVDLTGYYVQQKLGEAYQSAVITNDSIDINWHLDGDSFLDEWPYWSGTFEPPAGNEGSYSWTSQNNDDVKETGGFFLNSNEPTKEFTIKNGVLFYDVTIDGVTYDLALTKMEGEGVFLDEFGYSFETVGDRYRVNYGYVLKNTISDRSVFSPEIEIVVKDAEDNIIWKTSTPLLKIRSGETLIGADFLIVDSEPEVVQIELKSISRSIWDKTVGSQAFEVKNLKEINEDSRKRITGEIYNMSDEDYPFVLAHALFRLDGEIVGGEVIHVFKIPAGSSVEFESLGMGPDNYDSFEVIAYPMW